MSDDDRRCVEAALPNMMMRPKGKRRVKPIPSHLLQLTFGMESDTDDDTEYTCAKEMLDNSVSSPDEISQCIDNRPQKASSNDKETKLASVKQVEKAPIVQLTKVIWNTDPATKDKINELNKKKNDEETSDNSDESGRSSSPTLQALIEDLSDDDNSSDDSFKPEDKEMYDIKNDAMSKLLGSESSDESFYGEECESSEGEDSDSDSDISEDCNDIKDVVEKDKSEMKEKVYGSNDEDDEEDNEDENEDDGVMMTIGQLIQSLKNKPNDDQIEEDGKLFCSVCLCDDSNEDDGEIMQCDNCGITVHEACYGQSPGDSDSEDAKSTESEYSTEPWFCDACRANQSPSCELCPTDGGLFKETYDGKWVHTVCALYTQDVEFGSVEKLSPIILTKIPESRWHSRLCEICKNSQGIVIRCDAGLCKIHFHVTCAQRDGLLTEAPAHEMVADPFYANCLQHCNKDIAKEKKRIYQKAMKCTAIFLKNKDSEGQSKRVLSRLEQARRRYKPPFHSRTLANLTAASVYMTNSIHIAKVQDDLEVVEPKFSVQFVKYFTERELLMKKSEDKYDGLQRIKDSLRREEKGLQDVIHKLESKLDKLREDGQQLWRSGNVLHEILNALAKENRSQPTVLARGPLSARQEEPEPVKKKARRVHHHKEPAFVASLATVEHSCCICNLTSDQDKQVECDKCHNWYHMGCVDPPLKKMPSKSCRYVWHCHKCDREKDFFLQPNVVGDSSQVSSKHGRAIRIPEKFMPPDELPKKVALQPNSKRKRPANSKNAGRKKGSGEQPPPKKDKKERDVRKECTKCSKPGDNHTLVRCDTCRKCYHFQCLDPPRKSTPRKRGYFWYCIDCIPSSDSEDNSWEVLDRAEKMCRKVSSKDEDVSDADGDIDE